MSQALMDRYIDQNQLHCFEGDRGVRNLTKLVNDLGYPSLEEFLADNSGAIEAVIEFVTDCGAFDEKLEEIVGNDQDDDEGEDE